MSPLHSLSVLPLSTLSACAHIDGTPQFACSQGDVAASSTQVTVQEAPFAEPSCRRGDIERRGVPLSSAIDHQGS